MKRRLPKKVIIMFISIISFPIILLFIGCFDENSAYASSIGYQDNQRIYDDAKLLSVSELEELEEMCKDYGDETGIDIIILTHDNKDAKNPEIYIEDFEDSIHEEGDRVYFLYDNPRQEIFMKGYGLAETYIHSKRIDVILDNMIDDLRDDNFFAAFETYITSCAAYMNDDTDLNFDYDYIYDVPSDESNDYDYDYTYEETQGTNAVDIISNIWFQLIASIIIGAITVGIMAYNSSGKMSVSGSDYLDKSRSPLKGKRDTYIRTTITKVRVPKQTSSSGRSGGINAGGFRGGVSSGGRSHSSGGRRL